MIVESDGLQSQTEQDCHSGRSQCSGSIAANAALLHGEDRRFESYSEYHLTKGRKYEVSDW